MHNCIEIAQEFFHLPDIVHVIVPEYISRFFICIFMYPASWYTHHSIVRGSDCMYPEKDEKEYIEFSESEGLYQPAPEDFDDGPPSPPGPLSVFPSRRHILPALACFMMFYAMSVVYRIYPYGDLLWVSGSSIFDHYEFWRPVTALFVHSGMGHLLSNAIMFFVFGWVLKAYFGYLAFPVTAFVIGVVSNIITVYLYPPEIRLLGASGMIYGMAALWLVYFIKYDDHAFPVRVMRAAGFVLVILIPSTIEPQVSYLAHGIGFIAGVIVGFVTLPFVNVRIPD